MRVHHRLVNMFMFMALGEMQPNTQAHQSASHKQLNGNGLSESHDSNYRTKEWCGRKISAGTRRTKMPKRDYEKSEAYPVAKKTDDARKQNIKRTRQRASGRESERDTDGSGNEALEFDNLQGIGQRNFSRQIVVEAPHDAGADDGEGANYARHRGSAGPRESGSAGNKENHAERNSAIEILMEDEPSHQCGRCAFKGQQQRGRSGVSAGQSHHQQDGTRYSAGSDCRCQPWDVLSAKGWLSGCRRQDSMGEPTQYRHA